MLTTIKNKILSFKSALPDEGLPQASVLLALTESSDPQLIFTLRSSIKPRENKKNEIIK